MLHVYPLDEESRHNLTGTVCECIPTVDFSGSEAIVVHNAFDGREMFEQLAEEINKETGTGRQEGERISHERIQTEHRR